MRLYRLLIAVISISLFTACNSISKNQYKLDVQPTSLLQKEGQFTFDETVRILLAPDVEEVRTLARQTAKEVKKRGDYFTSINYNSKLNTNKAIRILISTEVPYINGYQINVDPDNITVLAPRPSGLEEGLRVLYQLMGDTSVPCVEIKEDGIQ